MRVDSHCSYAVNGAGIGTGALDFYASWVEADWLDIATPTDWPAQDVCPFLNEMNVASIWIQHRLISGSVIVDMLYERT